MNLKCVIVDDEPLAIKFLQRYCEKEGSTEVSGTFPDAPSALDYLTNNEIDILFLDVEMPGDTGFGLLDQLTYMPKVVLTTSKIDYAFDAFQYNVTDYLKKPIPFKRFQESIQKIKDSIEKNIPEPEQSREDIFIKSNGRFVRLNYEDILYIESNGDYVKYFTPTQYYLAYGTLKSVEEKMDSRQFLKVHRSYIVNMSKIKDIQDNSIVINSKVIPISKKLKANVMSRINVS